MNPIDCKNGKAVRRTTRRNITNFHSLFLMDTVKRIIAIGTVSVMKSDIPS